MGRAADVDVDADAESLAAALSEASFVHLLAHADGDALAASALLADALADAGTPYQVSAARTAGGAARRVADGDERTTHLTIGVPAGERTLGVRDRPAAPVAFDAARALGGDPAPALALAGVIAAGTVPVDDASDRVAALLATAREAGIERRPGVAVPTRDLADGLAHSTLVHASFSGETDAAQARIAELALPVDLDDEARRTIASLLALDAPAVGERGLAALERALRPLTPGGPFATVGGYADVLDAAVRARPGAAVALALDGAARDAALDAWRDRSRAAHAAVRAADLARYSGVVVADVGDAPVWPVARLLRDFRSPEPVALAVGDDEAALAMAGPDADAVGVLTAAADERRVAGTAGLAYVRAEEAIAEEVREVLP